MQLLAQLVRPLRLFGHELLRQLHRLAEADDPRDVQRPAAHPALVAAAIDDGSDADARLAADPERADSLGTVDLVGRQGSQVDLHFLHVERHLAHALHRVDVEEHALLAGHLAEFRDGLQGPDLVVREHDRDEDRLVRDRLAELLCGNTAEFVRRQVGDVETLPLEPLGGIQRRLVLGADRDDVIALLLVELAGPLEGQVDALGSAGGEDDLFLVPADQGGDLLARPIHGLLGLPSERVAARGGVAELSGEIRHHRLQDPRIERGGGVVVHVDRELDRHVVPNVD